MNEDQAQATAQAVQTAAGHQQTVADVQNAQLQALIQNAAANGAQIVNSQGLFYFPIYFLFYSGLCSVYLPR